MYPVDFQNALGVCCAALRCVDTSILQKPGLGGYVCIYVYMYVCMYVHTTPEQILCRYSCPLLG